MRKILSFIISCAIVSVSITAFAQKEYSYHNDVLVFESEEKAVISCYDDNGVLVYSDVFSPVDGVISADVPEKFRKMKMRVYETGKEVVSLTEKAPEPTASPDTEVSHKYPSVYPSEADANRAFLVCNKVSLVATEDGSEMYKLDCFQKGAPVEVLVGTDITINSAPLANIAVSGQTAAALKRGDVFRITTNIAKTRVKSIDLMLRAFPETIATDGTNFYDLFSLGGSVGGNAGWKAAEFGNESNSKYQYAFGIVVDKSQHYISLMDSSGKTSDIMEIDIEPDTIVYECDAENKYEFSPSSTMEITKTYVRSSELDGEVIDWTKYNYFTYAFVRIIDSVATDIVYYHNF